MSNDKTPPRKILHIINGEYYAGAERVQDLLATNLPDFGFEVSFVCLKPGAFLNMRHYTDAHAHLLPMRSPFDLFPVIDLVRLLQKEKFALIHTHYPRSDMIGALASIATGTPMVLHVHSSTLTDSENIFKKWLNMLTERACMLRAKRIIAVSDKLRDTFARKKSFARKTHVIHNGVPTTGPLKERRLHKAKPVIGIIAFWRPGKGLEILFAALNRLQQTLDHFTLRIIGGFISDEYKEQAERLAHENMIAEKIDWVGPTTEIQNELEQMDILVLPSLNEGLPMVILEAMAGGVPVVASDVGGIPEIIRHGTDGLLVPPKEPLLLAEAIQNLLGDEEQWLTFRQNGYQRQKELFSDSTMTARLAEVYNDLLSGAK